jgi:hypothetical protein
MIGGCPSRAVSSSTAESTAPPGQRRHHVGGSAGGGVEQDRPHAAVDRVPFPEGEHLGLGRLLQPQVGEAGVLPHQPLAGQQRPGLADLARPEPLQRMHHDLRQGPYGHVDAPHPGSKRTAAVAPAVDIAAFGTTGNVVPSRMIRTVSSGGV